MLFYAFFLSGVVTGYVRVEVDEIPKGLNEEDLNPGLPPGSVAA